MFYNSRTSSSWAVGKLDDHKTGERVDEGLACYGVAKRSSCELSEATSLSRLDNKLMRTFFIAFILSILGGGLGYWRATDEHGRIGDVVGENLDLASLARATREIDQLNEKSLETSGVVSADLIPKVEVIGGTELDFGTMKIGTERSHDFRIKNSGQAPLELSVLGSTCKCTIGSLAKSKLQPGEETQVKLTWKAEGVLRDFAQTAKIGTNDPRQTEVLLAIRGKIGRTYVVEPEELNFGDFSARESFTKTFKLYSCEETELVVSGYWAEIDQQFIKVESSVRRLASNEAAEIADARYVADFKVNVSPGLPAGPINGQVHIEAGQDKTPISVRCSGKCVSDLRIIPGTNYDQKINTLNLGSFKSEKGGEKTFLIAARNPGNQKVELKLKKILPESLKDHFEVEIDEPTNNESQSVFRVNVKIPKGTPPFNRGGTTSTNFVKMFFETNLGFSNEISVNLRLIVEE